MRSRNCSWRASRSTEALPELILLLAAAAAAQTEAATDGALIKPSASAAIASAVGDCWAAVGANGVDRTRLAGDGWSPVAATSGSTSESPLEAFSKPGAEHFIMLAKEPKAKSLCTVIARVSSREDARSTLGVIQKSLQSVDPGVKAARSGEGVAFLSLPRLAQIDLMTGASGTEEQPGLRIVVGYQNPEKK